MKEILVAADGSPASDRAVDVAAELAKSLGAGLLILTVQEPLSREALEAFKTIEHVAESDVAAVAARSVLASARERAKRAGAIDLSFQVEAGDPTEMILSVARQRGNLAGLLLGSVSQKLVSLAPCNVIVVP